MDISRSSATSSPSAYGYGVMQFPMDGFDSDFGASLNHLSPQLASLRLNQDRPCTPDSTSFTPESSIVGSPGGLGSNSPSSVLRRGSPHTLQQYENLAKHTQSSDSFPSNNWTSSHPTLDRRSVSLDSRSTPYAADQLAWVPGFTALHSASLPLQHLIPQAENQFSMQTSTADLQRDLIAASTDPATAAAIIARLTALLMTRSSTPTAPQPTASANTAAAALNSLMALTPQGAAAAVAAAGVPVHANNARYKTELCRSWEETGTCRYGSRCQFAHGKEELRTVPRHPKYKTEICRTFATTGACPYGRRCRFIHYTEALGSLKDGASGSPPATATACQTLPTCQPAVNSSVSMFKAPCQLSPTAALSPMDSPIGSLAPTFPTYPPGLAAEMGAGMNGGVLSSYPYNRDVFPSANVTPAYTLSLPHMLGNGGSAAMESAQEQMRQLFRSKSESEARGVVMGTTDAGAGRRLPIFRQLADEPTMGLAMGLA